MRGYLIAIIRQKSSMPKIVLTLDVDGMALVASSRSLPVGHHNVRVETWSPFRFNMVINAPSGWSGRDIVGDLLVAPALLEGGSLVRDRVKAAHPGSRDSPSRLRASGGYRWVGLPVVSMGALLRCSSAHFVAVLIDVTHLLWQCLHARAASQKS